MKLGELLMVGNVVTEEQLHHALRRQKLLGGRLGSVLLELRLVTERVLARVLARQSGLQAANADEFEEIPPDVIRLIPPQYIKEKQILPLRKEGKKLHLAVMDPLDLGTQDTLEFLTGCKIVQWIAPEVRLLYGLEKYYQINRNFRFVNILRGGPPPEDLWDSSSVQMPPTRMIDPGSDRMEALEEEEPIPPPPPPKPATTQGDSAFRERMLAAQTWQDVVSALLDQFSRKMERVILYEVTGNIIKAWHRPEDFQHGLEGQVIPVDPGAATFIRAMGKHEGMYYGPLETSQEHTVLIGALGALFPTESVIVPLPKDSRSRLVIYGDNLITRTSITAAPKAERYFRMGIMALKIIGLRKQLAKM